MAGDGTRAGKPNELIEVCWLFPATSAKGTEYLRGKWGGVRVVVLPKRAADQGEHTHTLCLAAMPPRNGGAR